LLSCEKIEIKSTRNIEISMEWKDEKLIRATLTSQNDKAGLINYQGKTIEIN